MLPDFQWQQNIADGVDLHLKDVASFCYCASRNASVTLSACTKVNLLAHDDATRRGTKNAKTAFLRLPVNPVYVHLLKQEQQKNNIFIPKTGSKLKINC